MAEEESQHSKFSLAKQTKRVLRSALFWVITQEESLGIFSWISGLSKTGTIVCPDTSVKNCHYTLRKNPEQRRSHLLCGGNLKSRTIHEF